MLNASFLTLYYKEAGSGGQLCCILGICCHSKNVLQCSFYKLLEEKMFSLGYFKDIPNLLTTILKCELYAYRYEDTL